MNEAADEPKTVPRAPQKPPIWLRCLTGGLALILLFIIHRVDAAAATPWIATTLAVGFGLLGAWELYQLLAAGGFQARTPLGVAAAAVLLAGKAWCLRGGGDPRLLTETAVVGLLIVSCAVEVTGGDPAGGARRLLAQVLVLVYVLAFSFLLDLLLRPAAPLGIALALLTVVTAKASDIGGYLVGNLVGGPKLAPKISPGKTRSGAAGGVALSMGVAAAGGHLIGVAGLPWWLLFGAVVAVVAQFGDLAESLLKRACGVKDSSGLVPTFGGVLDMIDSLVLAAPVGYWLLAWRGIISV